jgi:hypothetical protein
VTPLNTSKRSRFLLAVVLTIASLAGAGIRPSFLLDYATREAHEIMFVVATETPGKFTVIESLKGELIPGEEIAIPELRPKPDAVPLYLYAKREPITQSERLTDIPQQISGTRLLLFLKHKEKGGWEGANPFKHMKASVVWFEGEQLFGFAQGDNPGPSLLAPLYNAPPYHVRHQKIVSEQDLRSRIKEILTAQALERKKGPAPPTPGMIAKD